MIPNLVQNGAVASRAYPQAAQKSQIDAKQLEKQGNEQIAERRNAETTSVATRQKPVQANEGADQSTLDNASKPAFPRASDPSSSPASMGLSVYA